jgi:hypothetical protein
MQDLAGIGIFQPGDAVQQGALADARLAHQGHDLAGADGEAQGGEQWRATPRDGACRGRRRSASQALRRGLRTGGVESE